MQPDEVPWTVIVNCIKDAHFQMFPAGVGIDNVVAPRIMAHSGKGISDSPAKFATDQNSHLVSPLPGLIFLSVLAKRKF